MIQRIVASLILLFSILYMPFYLSIILALIGIIYFSFYWESVFLFFISDLIFGIKEEKLLNIYFISFLISFIVLISIELLKRKIRISK